jgi:hypothetical protein
MTRPVYGRFSEGINVPTEILASNEGMEKIGITVDNTSAAVAAFLTTAGGNANSHITITAKQAGTFGNQLAVVIAAADAANETLAASVADGVLTVALATNGAKAITTTATELAAIINSTLAVAAVFSAAVKAGETGAGIVAAVNNTHLASGANADPAAAIVKGTVMARITATGLYVPYDDDGTDDGRRTAQGIIVDDIDPAKADQNDLNLNASMYVRGSFQYDKLTGLDANAITDLNARYIAGQNLLLF